MRKRKVVACCAAAVLGLTSLTGCNKDMWDTEWDFDAGIVFENGRVTVYPIKKYAPYDGYYQFILSDNTVTVVPVLTTHIIHQGSTITTEDYIRTVYGEDVEVNYLNPETIEAQKTLSYTR